MRIGHATLQMEGEEMTLCSLMESKKKSWKSTLLALVVMENKNHCYSSRWTVLKISNSKKYQDNN